MTDDSPFGKPIFTYSRAQAIEDGVLVDVTETAKEAGIVFPVALTSAVFERYVRVPPGLEGQGQSERGRLWDICWMFRFAARASQGDTLLFKLHVAMPDAGNWDTNEGLPDAGSGLTRERHRLVTLKAVCGPGDDPKPVITIMLPDED